MKKQPAKPPKVEVVSYSTDTHPTEAAAIAIEDASWKTLRLTVESHELGVLSDNDALRILDNCIKQIRWAKTAIESTEIPAVQDGKDG